MTLLRTVTGKSNLQRASKSCRGSAWPANREFAYTTLPGPFNPSKTIQTASSGGLESTEESVTSPYGFRHGREISIKKVERRILCATSRLDTFASGRESCYLLTHARAPFLAPPVWFVEVER